MDILHTGDLGDLEMLWIFYILVTWVICGLMVVIPARSIAWWDGEDFTEEDLRGMLTCMVLGPVVLVVLLQEFIGSRWAKFMVKRRGIIFRGRKSARVFNQLKDGE
jgi:Kef-type K+ transport system membrane component KefB